MKNISYFVRSRYQYILILAILISTLPILIQYYVTYLVVFWRFIIKLFYLRHFPLAYLYADTMTFWTASKVLFFHDIAKIYDPAWFYAVRNNLLHIKLDRSLDFIWLYPPPTILLTAFLAPFSYPTAFAIWMLALLGSTVLLLKRAGVPGKIILLSLASPAFLSGFRLGQPSILTEALLLAGLIAAAKGEDRSGIFLGAIIFKPQDGLLAPIALLARRRFRAFGLGVATVAALVVTITLIGGTQVWISYIQTGLPAARAFLLVPFSKSIGITSPSVFWMARSFGGSIETAWIAQIAGAIFAACWCWIAWQRPHADHVTLVTLTAILMPLASPYGFTYDLFAMAVMTSWLSFRSGRLELMHAIIWLWPAYCAGVGQTYHLQITPLILLIAAILTWQRLEREATEADELRRRALFGTSRHAPPT